MKNARILSLLSLLVTVLSPSLTSAAVKIVTSTTDLAWTVREIGGANVEVKSLLKGHENPHFVDAVPDFIRLTADAQAVCIVGLDLEMGWMPKVLSRSGNSQVQPGGKGYCETGRGITVRQKPTGGIDRSMGDVHPNGNPHYWLSPKHLAQAATPIVDTLSKVDPAHMGEYQQKLAEFKKKMDEIVDRNRKKLAPVLKDKKGPLMMEYHQEFTYFLDTYGLHSLGSLEEKPGVQPSAGRIAEMAQAAKGAGIKFLIAGDTAPRKTLEKFSELSGIPLVIVPLSLQSRGQWNDYPKWQDHLVDEIVQALQPKKT